MNNSHGQPGPFAPPPLQEHQHYYGPVRQRAGNGTHVPTGHTRLGHSLSPLLKRQFPDTPSHVPHESRRPGSRHLYAGHHLASKRVSAKLIPEHAPSPRF